MLPKIASALARVLDPIRPIARPGQSLLASKSAETNGGGYGSPGYEAPPEKNPESGIAAQIQAPLPEDAIPPEPKEKCVSALAFQPGLTQVILDLNGVRSERNAGTAAQTYETGAKDQKKNARLPKGSMLDKKVG